MKTLTGLRALKTFAEFYGDPIACVEKVHARHGDAIALQAPLMKPAGTPQSYLFIGPAYNKAILLNQKHLRPTGAWPTPGKEGTSLQNLRQNILCARGEEHDTQLAAILPLMSRTQTRSLFDRVKTITGEEIKRWPQDEATDVTHLTRRLTQRLSFDLLFGAQSTEEMEKTGSLVDAFHRNSWSRGALSFRVDAPLTPYRRLLKSAQSLEKFSMAWGGAQKGCPVSANVRAALANTSGPDGAAPTPEKVAANVAAIGMASYETSALTLSWALFLLTQHPSVLAALTEEVQALGPLNDVDAQTLDAQPLLDGVIKETMRLITPVPIIGFVVMEDCEVAGASVKQGARVFISPHLTHRLPDLYENPRRFTPERWASLRPSAYEYLPFNAGPRRCPGIWFATANLKTALATIVSTYQFTLAPDARIDRGYAATTIPKSGVPMRFTKRTGQFERDACRGDIFKFIDIVDAA